MITLVPAPDVDPDRISTAIGDLEFTTLHFPPDHEFLRVVVTSYGLVAIDDFPSLCWSSNGENWECVPVSVDPRRLTSAGDKVIVHGLNFSVLYAWDGNNWTEIARLNLTGLVEQIVFGPHDVVAVCDHIIQYSSDGVHFTEAEFGPNKDLLMVEEIPRSYEVVMGGGCRGIYRSSNTGSRLGPILATDAGFVALTPSHPADWDNTPICEPILWFSTEGFVWELVSEESPFGDGAFIRDINERNGRFVATGGFDWDVGAVWSSDDGLIWERAAVELNYAGTIASGDKGWMLLGRVDRREQDSLTQQMWFSTDGLTWDGPYQRPDGLTTGFLSPQLAIGNDVIFGIGSDERVPVLGRLQPQIE